MENTNEVCHWVENQFALNYGERCINLYDIEMVQMYHTLAKEVNEKFGTDYPYSQKVIDKLHKKQVFGNIRYIGGFYFTKQWAHDSYELNEWYYYDGCGRCESTYGNYWKKEDIIAMVEILKPYVMNNWIADVSRKTMTELYDYYDRIGIGYAKRADYFDDMLWID